MRSDRHDRRDRKVTHGGAAREERQLQHDGGRDRHRLTGEHEVAGGGHGAAGGQHVVDEQHPLTRRERVAVHLDGGLAVLQLVGHGVGLAGQLAGLAHRDEADTERQRHRGAEREAACLDPGHLVDGDRAVVVEPGRGQRCHHGAERLVVGEDRCEVLEHNPRLGEVRDVDREPDDLRRGVGQSHVLTCRAATWACATAAAARTRGCRPSAAASPARCDRDRRPPAWPAPAARARHRQRRARRRRSRRPARRRARHGPAGRR